MRILKFIVRVIIHLWAAPNSLIGLIFGLLAVLLGARVRAHRGSLEFGGGLLGRLVARLPARMSFSAITFGHIVLGVDAATLAAVRAHEQVHVHQYECWGPLFIPAYLLSGLLQLLCGRRPYFDNYFERDARAKSEVRHH